MANRACVALLAVVAVFATAVSASKFNVPAGTIVATGDFGPVAPNTTTAHGRATLIIPPAGNASCSVNLTGSLEQIVMAHIHWNTTSAPILVGLMPRYDVNANGTNLVPLNPYISYKGSFNFLANFALRDRANFTALLKAQKLFVNVHTAALMGGATQARLICKVGC